MFPLSRPFKATRDALELSAAILELTSAAAEVIFRRTQLVMSGRMTAPDAVAMLAEKATVFGDASQLATVAAARGGDPLSIARAALAPYGLKARANAERLRL
jgi:hypothetical protein